jgi:Tfp pilus assembly protein PilF
MSLLMEALKKAEETRRQADGKNVSAALTANPDTNPDSILTTTPPTEAVAKPILTVPPGSPLSPQPSNHLAWHLDAVDAERAATSSAPPARHPPLAENSEIAHSAASQAFVAQRPPKTGNVLWPIVGVGLLALLGVGGYFWWQLQAVQPPVAAHPMMMPSTPSTSQIAAPSVPLPPAGESGTIRPAPEATPVPLTGKSVVSAQEPAALLPPIRAASTPEATEPRQTQTDTMFRLTHASPRTNTVLEHAYEALQTGQNEEAQRDYEQVLRADGKNTDALLGLATLAARQGWDDKAHDYYLRALEANPGDSTAQAGVLSTGHEGDDEGLLKAALTRQPDSPPLLFALGNLYAHQQRWSEAQAMYFQAYTGEPDNPDIVFNLAVSLDHLHQARLAAQYYRMALNAGDTRTVAFSRNQVETRLLELQP